MRHKLHRNQTKGEKLIMKIFTICSVALALASTPAFAERSNRQKLITPPKHVRLCTITKTGNKLCLKWKSGNPVFLYQISHGRNVEFSKSGVITNIAEPKPQASKRPTTTLDGGK
jgi:hypothetical protein